MSLADHIFIDMCRDILENGTDTMGEKVRPKWGGYRGERLHDQTFLGCEPLMT